METTIGSDISKASQLLASDEIVAVPTETVYGLAGSVFSEKAVAEIFKVKNRPEFDPLIVHTFNTDEIRNKIALENDPRIDLIEERFWPGPITIVVKKRPEISEIITAGLETVAIRIPDHPVLLGLLKAFKDPLAAPSANPFGYISPTTAEHVKDQLNGLIPYILEGGDCLVGIESTIIDLSSPKVRILRKGKILQEEIEDCLKETVEMVEYETRSSPGSFGKHYSPGVPCRAFERSQYPGIKKMGLNTGVIAFNRLFDDIPEENQLLLSPSGDLGEAAHNLYAHLREFDKENFDRILIEKVPNKGLGIAINDRIDRASTD